MVALDQFSKHLTAIPVHEATPAEAATEAFYHALPHRLGGELAPRWHNRVRPAALADGQGGAQGTALGEGACQSRRLEQFAGHGTCVCADALASVVGGLLLTATVTVSPLHEPNQDQFKLILIVLHDLLHCCSTRARSGALFA